jgi:hypothetical protein
VGARGAGDENPASITAVPVEGGETVQVCVHFCVPEWSVRGDFMFMQFFVSVDQNTYVLRLRQPNALADLPSNGELSGEILKKAKPMLVIPRTVDSAVSTSLYAYTVKTTRRNLYRIPLQ